MSNQPSEKQIAFILQLINGRHESHAYAEIAKDMGVSTAAAEKRSTMQDASRTIDRLKSAR